MHICKQGDLVLVIKGTNKEHRCNELSISNKRRVQLLLDDATIASTPVTSIKLLDPEHLIGNATPFKNMTVWKMKEVEITGVLPHGIYTPFTRGTAASGDSSSSSLISNIVTKYIPRIRIIN